MKTDKALYTRIRNSVHYEATDFSKYFSLFQTADSLNVFEVVANAVDLENRAILDLGAGTGALSKLLQNRIGARGSLTLVEFDKTELQIAREEVMQPKVRFLNESAQDISLAKDSIDVVFCNFSVMFFRPFETALAEITRVLKPGGLFVATVLSADNPKNTALYQNIINQYENKVEAFCGWGDPRTKDGQVLGAALLDSGCFNTVDVSDYNLFLQEPLEVAMKALSVLYQVHYLLMESERKNLMKELDALLEGVVGSSGTLHLELPISLCIARVG